MNNFRVEYLVSKTCHDGSCVSRLTPEYKDFQNVEEAKAFFAQLENTWETEEKFMKDRKKPHIVNVKLLSFNGQKWDTLKVSEYYDWFKANKHRWLNNDDDEDEPAGTLQENKRNMKKQIHLTENEVASMIAKKVRKALVNEFRSFLGPDDYAVAKGDSGAAGIWAKNYHDTQIAPQQQPTQPTQPADMEEVEKPENFDVSNFGDDTFSQIDNMKFTDAQKAILKYALELEEDGFSDEEYYDLVFYFASKNGLNESKCNGKAILKESASNWYGCPKIKMIWHGEWSDPELEYNGNVVNYWDVEDWCVEACKEEGVNYEDDEAFGNWVRQNEDRICAEIEELASTMNESKKRINESQLRRIVENKVRLALKGTLK